MNSTDFNFESLADKDALKTTTLGTTAPQFAARNFASQALNVITSPLAGKAWSYIFGKSGSTKDYLKSDFIRISITTQLLSIKEIVSKQPLVDAYNKLQKSLDRFEEGRSNIGIKEKRERLFESLDLCKDACNILDDKDDATWIGGYYTAVSQYAFLASQVLVFQKQPDYNNTNSPENIVDPKTIASYLKKAKEYVSNKDRIDKIHNEVKGKFGEITHKGSTHPYGFVYAYDGQNNFLRNGSKQDMIKVRENLLNTALNAVNSEIIQPDVVRIWDVMIDELEHYSKSNPIVPLVQRTREEVATS
ncbi:hypothetical protein ACSLBF_04720 [Pseudoalteromonas sp. T1lg65]|uniref:hypothetical protein n=1 Tax=Pseudoalteromonas sp. T1lg65 TaxID=2077101 RepID=UPI003F7A6472